MFGTTIIGTSPFAGGIDYQQAGASGPVIADVTAGNTSIVVTYSGTATQYRINGGSPTAIGASPATIAGLTANTEYNTPGIEIRDGTGEWSSPVAFGTTNVANGDDEILPSYVQSDLVIAWEVLTSALLDQPMSWEVINSVQGDLSISYAAQGSATADLSISYAVQGSTFADQALSWSIEASNGSVNADLTITWGIAGQTVGDLPMLWGVLNAAASDLPISYAILSPVFADSGLSWSIDGGIISDLPLTWDIGGTVMRDLGLSWAIQDTASEEQWPLNITLTPVYTIRPNITVNRPSGLTVSLTPR